MISMYKRCVRVCVKSVCDKELAGEDKPVLEK